MKTSLAFGVVILGAGASSRMGRPKLLLPWRDTTIIGHIIRQWQELSAKQIVIVHRPNDTLMAAELNSLGFSQSDRIENPQPEQGMFSSIRCAANWNGWKEDIASQVIVLGDQPHLPLDVLRAFLKFHQENPDSVCQPEFEGRLRHPVVMPRKVFDQLERTPAGTLKDFLKLIPRPIVQYPTNEAGLSLDVDTPEDYKEVLSQFSLHEKS